MSGTTEPITPLRRVRIARNISLRKLARISGIDYSKVWAYDHGLRISTTHLISLARCLDVDARELVNSEDRRG